MTKFSMLKLSLITAALTLASTNLNAQTPSLQAKINVPFAFQVGTVQFAPGTYTVGMLNGVTLRVQGSKNAAFASMLPAISNKPIAGGKVVFDRVGGQYFLREVWTAGTTEHLVAYESKSEKQAQKSELAANHPATSAAEIAVALGGR